MNFKLLHIIKQKNKSLIYLLLLPILQLLFACSNPVETELDLSGEWQFKIDSLDQGIKEKWYDQEFTETVKLPGSMVENNKGNPVGYQTKWLGGLRNKNWFEDEHYKPYLSKDEFLFPYWLIPAKHYYGAAWYQKTITVPSSWKEKNTELYLERAHWETQVWIDGKKIGMNNSLGTAHRYDLSNILTPGKHQISICVDNRMKDIDVGPDSHSVTDHTQSNWNGIVGELKLIKKEQISIANIRVFPDVQNKNIKVEVDYLNSSDKDETAILELHIADLKNDNSAKINPLTKEIKVDKKYGTITINHSMGEDVLLWDEFHPYLYKLSALIKTDNGEDKKDVTFGMRQFSIKESQFAINDRPVFLRGTLECAIFPKTGYPPTDVDSWKRIINICKDHGLNHIRFHSWCPPEAAFNAADELGFYYQVEASSWANTTSSIGDGKPIDQWLYEESERIVQEYGNHPSFCLMAYGNEPAGKNQGSYLSKFVKHWKSKDDRRVYTGGSGWPAIRENQFHVDPQPRIQGWGEGLKSIINSEPPRSDFDWSDKLRTTNKPIVSHEIGQWCVYPNLKEIKKYDGVLKAKNFEIFKKSLNAHKMGDLADSLLLASGKLQALCYKADIEAALRTPGFGGFQLLDLHDFPGQGTALVGVLDAFWEEKGYISPEEYRRFCNETVPLTRFSKRIFKSGEKFNIDIEVSHFGEKELQNITPKWKITDSDQKIIQQGALASTKINWGSGIKLGNINTSINADSAKKFTLEVEIAGFTNSWDLWVYPIKKPKLNEEILVVQKLNKKSIETLNNGGKVLLTIKKGSIKPEQGGDVGIGFSTIFWNTAWTGGQKPHTLGILCNPDHKALAEFPTEYHSNWQWWDAMTHSNAISLENLPDKIHPIVRVIDDWVTNNRLALLFEVKIGKGRLLISGIDLLKNIDDRPEANQLLYSLKKYMESDSFDPSVEVELKSIENLFK